MKLIGNLKEQVQKANNPEEAKDIIAKAGMGLTSDELEMVTGGAGGCPIYPHTSRPDWSQEEIDRISGVKTPTPLEYGKRE